MKVQTHLSVGEFAAGTLPPRSGQGFAASHELGTLRRFLHQEVRPWILSTGALTSDAEVAERQLVTSRSFMAADRTAQTFVERWIDPLFGNNRKRQLQELSPGMTLPETSLAQIINNRYLSASLVTLSFAIAGSLFFPPLIALGTLGALYMTLPLYVDAYRSLAEKRKIGLTVVAAIDVTGTWLTGSYVASALGSLLYYSSVKLVAETKARSQQQLMRVYVQPPRSMWVQVDGVEVEVPAQQVQAGDRVVVQAGQIIAVDGTVTQGSATLDQHTLTGEARSVEKKVGDRVFATMRVLSGSLTVCVEQVGAETAAAQIADILSHTASYQMSVQSQGERLANRAALPTLLIGGLVWPIVGYQGTFSVLGANFGLTTQLVGPIVMLNYLNILSHHSILVKDGRSLELLNRVDTLVFDQSNAQTLTPALVAQLQQRKLTLLILSDGPEAATRTLARTLGIDSYIANTSAEGKAALIERLQAQGRSVCFVGDGIADALALKKATVSVSLRGAATAATDAAQIVLMQQSLDQLPALFDVGREFHANLRRGFVAAFIPDVILVGGVFLLNFGVYASLILFNVGLLAGLGNAMLPALKHKAISEEATSLKRGQEPV